MSSIPEQTAQRIDYNMAIIERSIKDIKDCVDILRYGTHGMALHVPTYRPDLVVPKPTEEDLCDT